MSTFGETGGPIINLSKTDGSNPLEIKQCDSGALLFGADRIAFEPLSGSGSPEGVVIAKPKLLYLDTSGAAGGVLYIKQSGTGNTGWVMV